MKALPILLLCALPVLAQSASISNQSILQDRFKVLESQAPKGYPTLFVVSTASMSPGTFLGNDGGCVMNLETFGQIYFVTTGPGFLGGCKAFQPGTVVWGRVHRMLGTVVDVLDTSEGKPKSRRYTVKDVTLVNPANQ
jgi:hypothetical protein